MKTLTIEIDETTKVGKNLIEEIKSKAEKYKSIQLVSKPTKKSKMSSENLALKMAKATNKRMAKHLLKMHNIEI